MIKSFNPAEQIRDENEFAPQGAFFFQKLLNLLKIIEITYKYGII